MLILRKQYAIQWVWPVPIIVGVFLAPESPWWLVRKGRVEDAKKALRGLTSKTDTSYSIDSEIAMMIHTNEHEKYVSEGVGYLDCFTGVDLRRTEIISCVWMIQVWCGIWFGGVSNQFLLWPLCICGSCPLDSKTKPLTLGNQILTNLTCFRMSFISWSKRASIQLNHSTLE